MEPAPSVATHPDTASDVVLDTGSADGDSSIESGIIVDDHTSVASAPTAAAPTVPAGEDAEMEEAVAAPATDPIPAPSPAPIASAPATVSPRSDLTPRDVSFRLSDDEASARSPEQPPGGVVAADAGAQTDLEKGLSQMPDWGTPEREVAIDLHLRCDTILATRGATTDSYVLVVIFDQSRPLGSEDVEVGRTETVNDTLSPEFKTVLRLKYKTSDAELALRFDVIDPESGEDGEVIGSEIISLAQLHREVQRRTPVLRRGLRQHAELMGLISAKVPSEPEGGRETTGDRLREDMGDLLLVPELVCEDPSVVWMLLGTKSLRTDRLSLPPDPFVQILRRIADGSYCLVYRTNNLRRTRDAVWKTAPIPLQRICNGSPTAALKFEVWDLQDLQQDRLIGSVELTAEQLLSKRVAGSDKALRAEELVLQAPLMNDPRAGRQKALLGFGVASKPGTLSVLRLELGANSNLATRDADAFATEVISHEKKKNAMPPFVPLTVTDRRDPPSCHSR